MAKGATKKKALDPEIEAKMQELLGAVKRPKTLQDLHAALVVLPRAGEAGSEAMRRLQLPFKTFGGPLPGEDDQAVSWSPTHLLVIGEEGLESARLVQRRGVSSEAPKSEGRPRASNDAKDAQEGQGSTDDSSSENSEGGSSSSSGPDPEALRLALLEACKKHKVEARKIEVRAVRSGGQVLFSPPEGAKKTFDLDEATWGEPVETIVAGLVEVLTSVGE